MDDIIFADKERGIYASSIGAIYVCEPNSFQLKSSPLAVPAPFTLLTGPDFDPYFVVFSKTGYLQICNYAEQRWVLQTSVPGNVGVIKGLEIQADSTVLLKTSRGVFCYDHGWNILSEPMELLVVQQDQKIYAQASELENEISAAIKTKDFGAYENAVKRYLLCLAQYGPLEAFINSWYAVKKMKNPFEQKDVMKCFNVCIDLLSSIDRVSRYIEELKMSLA